MGICGERWKLNGARNVIRGEQEYVDSKGGAWRKRNWKDKNILSLFLEQSGECCPDPLL